MKQKLIELVSNDELILHKIGLLLGSVVGIVIGGVVSKRADDFETLTTHDIINLEEAPNGPEEN
jgi:hypothetical protein